MGKISHALKEVTTNFFQNNILYNKFIGESCIQELEKRFNPEGISDEPNLNVFIQK